MKSSISRLPGLYLIDHHFDVPLDYQEVKKGGEIKVFAREAISIDNVNRSNLPWLIFFQGGPGYHSPRPFANSGWFKRALRDFRVLLLDQRGTGRSTPV
ncbi:MAG TPA: alpha/beta fold hydrolase, partial [Candidatus Melainabacteria bacterium]|nr:alpha/beta fold hydrolase [Candidatus Melainabacteria bacterium]